MSFLELIVAYPNGDQWALFSKAFFPREIVDDCLQVRISKNLMLHAH